MNRFTLSLAAVLLPILTLFATQAKGQILITELDADADYFEIQNMGSSAVDVSGWSLNIVDDGLSDWSFTFDIGSILSMGETFGASDEIYGGSLVSPVNIPNSSGRGIYAYITDDSNILHDSLSITAGTDDGGPIPTNFISVGSVDWSGVSLNDAIVRTGSLPFQSSSFSVGSSSPIASTSLTGTSSSTASPIFTAVPEPSSAIILMAMASAGVLTRRRKS